MICRSVPATGNCLICCDLNHVSQRCPTRCATIASDAGHGSDSARARPHSTTSLIPLAGSARRIALRTVDPAFSADGGRARTGCAQEGALTRRERARHDRGADRDIAMCSHRRDYPAVILVRAHHESVGLRHVWRDLPSESHRSSGGTRGPTPPAPPHVRRFCSSVRRRALPGPRGRAGGPALQAAVAAARPVTCRRTSLSTGAPRARRPRTFSHVPREKERGRSTWTKRWPQSSPAGNQKCFAC